MIIIYVLKKLCHGSPRSSKNRSRKSRHGLDHQSMSGNCWEAPCGNTANIPLFLVSFARLIIFNAVLSSRGKQYLRILDSAWSVFTYRIEWLPTIFSSHVSLYPEPWHTSASTSTICFSLVAIFSMENVRREGGWWKRLYQSRIPRRVEGEETVVDPASVTKPQSLFFLWCGFVCTDVRLLQWSIFLTWM